MNSYQINYPEKIIFGADSVKQLSEIIPLDSEVMLVTGKSAVSSGTVEKIAAILADFAITDAYGTTMPEPSLENVDSIIEIGRKNNVNAVVALGGGSTIDAAKAAAALIPLEGKTEEYFYGEKAIPGKGVFFAALPTTAGTGAEITNNSVLTDSTKKVKKSLRHPEMVADAAIIDPLLTINMPPSVTAASGLDALTQAIESYTSLKANSVSHALAKSAVVKLFHSLLPAYRNGKDIQARTDMAEGSLLSGMAFSQSGLGAVHGIAHPTGSIMSIPHGLTCAILLPSVMIWNAEVCAEQYTELANSCGLNDFKTFIDKICGLRKSMNVPESLPSPGLDKSQTEFVIKNCRSNSMNCNPRQMSDNNVLDILKKISGGI